jgi:hypothetical protein
MSQTDIFLHGFLMTAAAIFLIWWALYAYPVLGFPGHEKIKRLVMVYYLESWPRNFILSAIQRPYTKRLLRGGGPTSFEVMRLYTGNKRDPIRPNALVIAGLLACCLGLAIIPFSQIAAEGILSGATFSVIAGIVIAVFGIRKPR